MEDKLEQYHLFLLVKVSVEDLPALEKEPTDYKIIVWEVYVKAHHCNQYWLFESNNILDI